MPTIHTPGPNPAPRKPIITTYLVIRLEVGGQWGGPAQHWVCGIQVDQETYITAFKLLMEWRESKYLLDEAHFMKSLRVRKRFDNS